MRSKRAEIAAEMFDEDFVPEGLGEEDAATEAEEAAAPAAEAEAEAPKGEEE